MRHRIAWTLLILAPGCGGRVEAGSGTEVPRSVRAAGVPGPVVLYPRHRIVSPYPPLMFVVPGDRGPAAVVLTVGGRSRTFRTRARSLPWPAGWPGLAVGDVGRAQVASGGLVDVATFARGRRPPGDLVERDPRAGARWWLRHGFPMEALRLMAVGASGLRRERAQALFRAGVPSLGLWQGDGRSDSIAPPRGGGPAGRSR